MSAKSVGGGSINSLTPGAAGGVGANNIGSLVRVWGKVTQRDKDLSFFYIDDGSGLMDGTETVGEDNVGIRIIANSADHNQGDYLVVTGVVSGFDCYGLRPQILPTNAGVQKLWP